MKDDGAEREQNQKLKSTTVYYQEHCNGWPVSIQERKQISNIYIFFSFVLFIVYLQLLDAPRLVSVCFSLLSSCKRR